MQPLKHQEKALQWIGNKDHVALFMEMRTGKSLVAIKTVEKWGGKTLMIAPISTWYDWQALLGKLGIKSITLGGTTKQKKARFDKYNSLVDWVIINPEGVTRWGKEFFSMCLGLFDNCILDESVFAKNPRAKITKLLMKYKDAFLHRMIMTGTPIAEQTEDVVTQLIWCNGSFIGHTNFYTWRMKFMQPAKFGWSLKKGVKQLIRDEMKRESFVLSAKDAGMFVDQVKQTHLVELPENIREDYQHIEQCWKLEKVSTKYGVVKDIWLAQLACGVYPLVFDTPSQCFKSPAVASICNQGLKGQQVVIFSRWRREGAAMATKLGCPLITGATPFEARDKLIKEFRQEKFQHLVMQTKCACRGLDLSCVDNAIMCSNIWQYEVRQQIIARMNHPFRSVPTLFIDILTNNTIEERVYELLQEKHLNARFFLQRLKARVKVKQ